MGDPKTQICEQWPFRGVCVTPACPLVVALSVWGVRPSILLLFLYLIIVHFSARINLSVTVILNGHWKSTSWRWREGHSVREPEAILIISPHFSPFIVQLLLSLLDPNSCFHHGTYIPRAFIVATRRSVPL